MKLATLKPHLRSGINSIRRLKLALLSRNNFKRLPTELVVQIFLLCLPTDRFPRPSRREAPVLLGRVCRAWRSVVLSTPQLWAHIALPEVVWVSEVFHSLGFHEWMRRVGTNCPLSFEIGHENNTHPIATAPLLTLLELQSETRRWKAIRIRSTCPCMDQILRTLSIPGETPMLEDLRIVPSDLFQATHPIACAPQLTTIHLCGFPLIHLPFTSDKLYAVRELRINPCESEEIFSLILAHCPLLEIFEISCRQFSPTDTRTVIQTLRYLHTFIFMGHNNHARLLNQLDAPALHSLAVSLFGAIDSTSSHLTALLMRCGGQLKRLKAHGDFITSDGLVDGLQHTSLLEMLCVEGCTLKTAMSQLCPRLVHFDILGFAITGPRPALPVLLSRWQESEAPRSVIMPPATLRVEFDTDLSWVYQQPDIAKCVKKGLRVDQFPLNFEGCWWRQQLYISSV